MTTRRTLLTGLAGGMMAASMGPRALAYPQQRINVPTINPGVERPTYLLSPHQDDELIRLGGYIVQVTDRGDEMHLIQATDGAATSVRHTLGVDASTISHWRNIEQRNSWQWLTNGSGQITYLNEPDGASNWQRIYNQIRPMMDATGPTSELYVAAWHHDHPDAYKSEDLHHDHVQCVLAARQIAADGYVVRFAVNPRKGDLPGRSVKYQANPGQQMIRIEGAVDSYGVVGYRSASKSLDAARGGLTRVTT